MEELINKILNYEPFCESEIEDKKCMLDALRLGRDVLNRDRLLHFTSSAFVVNPDRDKMLMVYHNIYKGLIYPGGHADGESNLLNVAIREVMEETSVMLKVLQKDVFGITVNPVNGHIKRGKYVSGHVHLDLIYLMEASEEEILKYRPEESSDVLWLPFEEVDGIKVVDYMRPVNARLVRKLRSLGL